MDNRHDFQLILLGTKTYIEEGNDLTPGYERGETLNAHFRSLQGQEFIDKHIVSGVKKQFATDIHTKVIEALWMALKAISEGKTTINICAHSRGSIESILVSHALEKILAALQDTTVETFNEKIINSPPIGDYLSNYFKESAACNNNEVSFASEQKKVNAANDRKTIKTNHKINIQNLIANAKSPIKCRLFMIDPVAGQSNLVMSWIMDEFFKIPNIVKEVKLIYMQDERTQYFEPVVPKEFPRDCAVEMLSIPGHHGTASGWLNEQGVNSSALINPDARTDKRRGKETRHTQKLVSAKLVEFFGTQSYHAGEPERASNEVIPPLSKSIHRRVRRNDLDAYKIKSYQKMHARLAQYNSFRNTSYSSALGWKKDRSTLTSTGRDYLTPFESHHNLRSPLLTSYVNDEHIRLSIMAFTQNFAGPMSASPADHLRHFITLFENKNGANTNALKSLYDNVELTEKYIAYFYKLISHALAINILNTHDNKRVNSKKSVDEIVVCFQALLAAIRKHESMLPLSKQGIANKLDDTWKNIIDHLSIFDEIRNLAARISNQLDEQESGAIISTQQITTSINRVTALDDCITALLQTKLINQNQYNVHHLLCAQAIKMSNLQIQHLDTAPKDDIEKQTIELSLQESKLEIMQTELNAQIYLLSQEKARIHSNQIELSRQISNAAESNTREAARLELMKVGLASKEQMLRTQTVANSQTKDQLAAERTRLEQQIQAYKDAITLERATLRENLANQAVAQTQLQAAANNNRNESTRLEALKLTLALQDQAAKQQKDALALEQAALQENQTNQAAAQTQLQAAADNNRNEASRLEAVKLTLASQDQAVKEQKDALALEQAALRENQANQAAAQMQLQAAADNNRNEASRLEAVKLTLASQDQATKQQKDALAHEQAVLHRNKTNHEEAKKQLQLLNKKFALKNKRIQKEHSSEHLLIQNLRTEIDNLEASEHLPPNATLESKIKLITDLNQLYKVLRTDIDQQTLTGKRNINSTTAGKIASLSVGMLRDIQKPNADYEATLYQYEASCKSIFNWQRYKQVIGMVCFAVIGFCAGVIIGASIGYAFGAWALPGAFVAAAIKLATGTATGASIAVATGTLGTTLTASILSGIFLHKPKHLQHQVTNFTTHARQHLLRGA